MNKNTNSTLIKSLLASKETLESSVSFLKKSPKIDVDQLSDESLEYSMIQWSPQWFYVSQQQLAQYQGVHWYCSICGQYIQQIQQAKGCIYKNSQNIYLSHRICLEKPQTDIVFDNSELIRTQIGLENTQKIGKIVALGQKEFFITLSVFHPLSSFMYFKLHKKLVFNGRSISWNFDQNSRINSMAEPNIVCIPISEFILQIDLQELSYAKNSKQNHKYSVDLSKVSFNSIYIEGQEKQIQLKGEFQILRTLEEKNKIINQMNFKYKHVLVENQPIIRFKRIELYFNNTQISAYGYDYGQIKEQQFQDLQIDAVDSIGWGCADSLVNQIWNQGSSQELYESQKLLPPQITLIRSQTHLPTYVQKSHLKDYICTLAGSKEMQKNIQFMIPQQINSIIGQLLSDFPQIIINEYGNYMFQSLLRVCSLEQRLKILGNLFENLKELVCSKQGTFSFQQFLNFITSKQEVEVIYQSLVGRYKNIAKDNYGTHFLRKLIKYFPIEYGIKISEQLLSHFVQLSLDKHAVCVLKILLSKISAKQSHCLQIRRQILHVINERLNIIIADKFGNYLIQQCFDAFQMQDLRKLNEKLLKNFKQYSMGSYSNNVIVKCIKCHWKDPIIYERIDAQLKIQDIKDMFNRKQSNKILLEILEHQNDFPLKIKIENVVYKLQQSKLNKQKWQYNIRKSQTDKVGSKYRTFSEAVESKGKKK